MERFRTSIVMSIEQPICYRWGQQTYIDESNPAVVPVIRNNRTLVPLRFLAESLQADVQWNGKTQTATITTASKNITISIGSPTMDVNGQAVPLDAPAAILQGRTMVPLRAIAEALDKEVFYSDGLIIISDSPVSKAGSVAGVAPSDRSNLSELAELVDSAAGQATSTGFSYVLDDQSYRDVEGKTLLQQYFQRVVLDGASENAPSINALIQQASAAFLENADEQRQFAQDNPPSGEYPYQNYADAIVTRNDADILSIQVTMRWFMGGVANTNIYGLNYNRHTGQKLALADVFSVSAQEAEAYLKQQTLQYMADHPDEPWWNEEGDSAADTVNAYTLDSFLFYLQDNQVYLCYSTYELGPGAMGPVVIPCDII